MIPYEAGACSKPIIYRPGDERFEENRRFCHSIRLRSWDQGMKNVASDRSDLVNDHEINRNVHCDYMTIQGPCVSQLY